MGLNIKNEETHRRARELAQLTGETVTDAIDQPLWSGSSGSANNGL
jgi:hypothetical protein